ncbi:sperm microtubule inner protein 6 isoform X2 [Notamacropus eugenii]|uniref:sperm microtubule inner protein 6 isoform X2 n=1 Tax=Notamacropus eugenii TaxID=9315 RepID=UPI003B66BF06
MFLFAHKTKTPISTYTDSYRPPASIKQDYKDPPLWAWEENKFVTQGLKKPMVEHHVDRQSLEKMVKRAVEEYSYKGSVPGNPYLPQKYWISEQEERYNPTFVSEDRFSTWRTGPYNSACWNKHTTYLPRLPKETGMETTVRGMPLDGPPKPDRFNNYEREVVVNMLNSLSRNQLPSIQPRSAPPYNHRPGMNCVVYPRLPPSYTNLKWNTSQFKLIGGPQRNNYIIHPEFVSEAPVHRCW